MSLKTQVQEDMKTAMRAKETLRLGTIRMLLAAIKQREIDERATLDDNNILSVINKMIKQRRDSAKQYQEAGRSELAAKELDEIKILQAYLPTQLSEAEIKAKVEQAIQAANATSMQDMGKVMGQLKNELQGQADMALVSKLVKENLSG